MRPIKTILRLFPIALVCLVASSIGLALVARFERTVEAQGEVRVHRYQIVRPEVSGRVSAVEVAPGDFVEPGQILLQLTDLDLEAEVETLTQSLQATRLQGERLTAEIERRRNYSNPLETSRSRAAVERSSLDGSLAESKAREVKIRLAAIHERLGQAEELFTYGLESQRGLAVIRRDAEAEEERLNQAHLDLKAARRRIPEMDRELRLLGTEHERILAELEGQAQLLEAEGELLGHRLQRLEVRRQRLTVRAEMVGVVTGSTSEDLLGRHLVPGEEIFHILDPTSINFVSWVTEESLVRVRPGQKALVELVGLPANRFRSFEGVVQRIGDPGIGPQGSSDTVFDVEITLSQPWLALAEGPFYLRGGMKGTAEIAFQYDVAPWQIFLELISGRPQLPEPGSQPEAEVTFSSRPKGS